MARLYFFIQTFHYKNNGGNNMYNFLVQSVSIAFIILNYILSGIWIISEILIYKKSKSENRPIIKSRYALVATIIFCLSLIYVITLGNKQNSFEGREVFYLGLTTCSLVASIYYNSQEL